MNEHPELELVITEEPKRKTEHEKIMELYAILNVKAEKLLERIRLRKQRKQKVV